jgi:glucokinase
MAEGYIIGVDLGGTNVRSAVVDDAGRISCHTKLSVAGSRSAEEVIDRVVACIAMTRDQRGGMDLLGVGVGTPGLIMAESGTVVYAPNVPGWTDLPLRSILQERLGVSVTIENDANAAAIGEHWIGAGKGVRHMICITLGTGVGGAIILNNQIWRGANGAGGEVGHINVIENGVLCGCGAPGCLEAYASASAIARQAREALRSGEKTRMTELCQGNPDALSSALVSLAAQEGDEVAGAIMRRAGSLLGVAVASLTNLLNPELFVIGGGLINAGALLFDPIWHEVRKRAYKWSASILRIVPAALGDDAGIIGAARNFTLTPQHSDH